MYHDTPEVFLKYLLTFPGCIQIKMFEHAPLEIVVSKLLAGSWYPE